MVHTDKQTPLSMVQIVDIFEEFYNCITYQEDVDTSLRLASLLIVALEKFMEDYNN